MVWEIVGHLGGLLVAISLTPQLIKTIKTKSTKDISLLWTSILMLGLIFYVVYAIKNNVVPLAVFGGIEFFMALTLFILKLKYK